MPLVSHISVAYTLRNVPPHLSADAASGARTRLLLGLSAIIAQGGWPSPTELAWTCAEANLMEPPTPPNLPATAATQAFIRTSLGGLGLQDPTRTAVSGFLGRMADCFEPAYASMPAWLQAAVGASLLNQSLLTGTIDTVRGAIEDAETLLNAGLPEWAVMHPSAGDCDPQAAFASATSTQRTMLSKGRKAQQHVTLALERKSLSDLEHRLAISDYDRARLVECRGLGAMAWLDACCMRTRMSSLNVGMHIARQLGVVTPHNAASADTTCGCGQQTFCREIMDEHRLHSLTCTRSGLHNTRHHHVKNDVANLFLEAGFSTFTEDLDRCWRTRNGRVNPRGLRMDVVVEGFGALGVPIPHRDTSGQTPQSGLPIDVTITSVHRRSHGARLDQPNTFLSHIMHQKHEAKEIKYLRSGELRTD